MTLAPARPIPWRPCCRGQANPNAVLDLDASALLIQMTPTGGETGARNSTLLILLGLATRTITPPRSYAS